MFRQVGSVINAIYLLNDAIEIWVSWWIIFRGTHCSTPAVMIATCNGCGSAAPRKKVDGATATIGSLPNSGPIIDETMVWFTSYHTFWSAWMVNSVIQYTPYHYCSPWCMVCFGSCLSRWNNTYKLRIDTGENPTNAIRNMQHDLKQIRYYGSLKILPFSIVVQPLAKHSSFLKVWALASARFLIDSSMLPQTCSLFLFSVGNYYCLVVILVKNNTLDPKLFKSWKFSAGGHYGAQLLSHPFPSRAGTMYAGSYVLHSQSTR